MLDKLGLAIRKATDKIANAVFLDKNLVENIIKELQRALIEADVNVSLVKELSDELRKNAFDERIKGIEKKEQLIKFLHDKILGMLGKEKAEIKLEKGKQQKILLLGLYGSGKTTTSSKLANFYAKRGLKTCILGLDVHRPAASEQLEQLGEKNSIKVFIDKQEKNPLKIYEKFKKELKNYDLTIIDTAGRHSLDKELKIEIETLTKKISPECIILVIPADIGQAARKIASEFQESCKISGVIVTRMDSSAKGGGALTSCNETKAKVFFITTGEHVQDIESFNPETFISRILGMGDLQTLMEKVSLAIDKDKQKAMQKKLEEGKFTMQDMLEQLDSLGKVGTFDKLIDLIPGLSKAKIPENLLGSQEEKVKRWKFAIQSMTQEEKENPEIIEKQTSRIARIAKGSGISTSDVRALLKQYSILKDFIKSGSGFDVSKGIKGIPQKHLMKLAKKFGKKIRI